MFGFIKAIGGALFGGSGNASKGADFARSAATGVGKWIDNRTFTQQEASTANMKTLDMTLKAITASQEENSVRSVTRRYIAWALTGFVLFWASIGMILASMDQMSRVQNMLLVADAFYIGIGFSVMLGFYFMASLVRGKR